jgi:hypothetical protein
MLSSILGVLSLATLSYAQSNTTTTIVETNSSGISTATILAGVAVAVSGATVVGFIVRYFKNGGTVSGLAKLTYENRDKIKEEINKLPIDELKKVDIQKIPDDLSKIKENVIELVSDPEKRKDVLDQLPVSSEVKSQLESHVKEIIKSKIGSETITDEVKIEYKEVPLETKN